MTGAEIYMGLRALVFDFDGVILESGEIKTQAFLELFADRPEGERRAILDHHLDHLGISRYEKLAWVYREIFGREITPEESHRLGEEFSRLVYGRMLSCPLVPGARELLAGARGRWATFVASGTPEAELRRIVERRGLEPYFDEVHGSPRSKEEILNDVGRRHGFGAREMLMIGDGWSDYQAARAVGCPFVLRDTGEQEEHFRGVEVTRVGDLTALAALLGLHAAAWAP